VDLIKMDVEGQEHALLAAMWEYLGEQRPTLFVEVLPGTTRLRALLAELCAAHGYRCYGLHREGAVELAGDALARVRLREEFGCQDVMVTARELPPR
jgi:hypothetical protein